MAARGDYGGDLKPRHSWAVQTPTPDEDDKRGNGPPPQAERRVPYQHTAVLWRARAQQPRRQAPFIPTRLTVGRHHTPETCGRARRGSAVPRGGFPGTCTFAHLSFSGEPSGFGSLGLAGTGWGCPERSEVAPGGAGRWHSHGIQQN